MAKDLKLGFKIGYWGAQPPGGRARARSPRPSGSATTRAGPRRRTAPTR